QQNFNKSEMHPSLPCWQTFSCTTASMRGWRASTQASPLSGMPMMPSCTAERRRKPKACARRSSCGWRNADWSLTSRKPKSFIARMRIGEERMSTRSLPSWAMSSDPGGLEPPGEILRELPAGYKRQSCKGHPRGNPRLETPIAERQILGRPGADVQSHPARVDAVLREILSFDASSGLSPLKPKVSALGLPEIQETPRSSAPGHPLAQTDLHPVCAALGPLANRSQGSDLITGAG